MKGVLINMFENQDDKKLNITKILFPNYGACLRIRGISIDVDFKYVTSLLDIEPTEILRKGERYIYDGYATTRINKHDVWLYRGKENRFYTIDDYIGPILDRLQGKEKQFKTLSSKYEIVLHCSALHSGMEYTPCICIKPEILRGLGELSIELEVLIL